MAGYQSTNPQTFFVSNVSTNGVVLQLAACSTMTALLTGDPKMTYWRFRYVQYTNFAMQSLVQPFDSTVAFGNTAMCKIMKAGDLLYFLYVVLQIPGIRACPPRAGTCGPTQSFPYSLDPSNPCAVTDAEYFATQDGGANAWLFQQYGSCGDYVADCAANACVGTGTLGACDSDPWVYWSNAIGQLIIRVATLIIGTQVIDTLVNDFLYIWEELAGKPGKRLTEMIGKAYCREQLIADSQETRTLYVPLPFYFTLTPGNALPLVALAFSGTFLSVNFNELRNLVVVSGPDIQVVKCNGGGPLNENDLKAAVDGTQIFLDQVERDKFASNNFEQLVVQTFALNQCVNCQQQRIQLNFVNPVIELIWAVRRQCAEKANNWFSYSGLLGREPVVAAELDFNATARQPAREGSWFRLVQPYQFHTLIPEAFIYCYSFALYPEDPQPSGSANFSRLESVTLIIQFQEGLQTESVAVLIFSRSLNMIRFRDGVAGLTFS
jgi:hypothetical protein